MKRLWLVFALIVPCGTFLWAGSPQSVWRSSFTSTADTTKNICGPDGGYNTNRRGILHSVCVSSNSLLSDVVTVYNSSASAINPMTVLDGSSGRGCFVYDIVASTINKGLTYSKTGTSVVEINYDCY